MSEALHRSSRYSLNTIPTGHPSTSIVIVAHGDRAKQSVPNPKDEEE